MPNPNQKGKRTNSKKRHQSSSPELSPTNQRPSKISATPVNMSDTANLHESMKSMLQQLLEAQTKEVKQLLNEHSSHLEKQITDVKNQQESLKNEIQSGNEQLKLELKSEFQQLGADLRKEVQTELQTMNAKMNEVSAKFEKQIKNMDAALVKCSKDVTNNIQNTERDFERIKMLNEVKIIGIEPSEGENLNEIFANIAKLVEFDLSNTVNIPMIKRLQKRNKSTGSIAASNMLIAKFTAPHIKESFYALYLKKVLSKQQFGTTDLGLRQEAKRIIIGENLTKHNSSLFIAAQKLKREGKLAQVWTSDGLVYIKIQKGTQRFLIREVGDLAYYIENAKQQPSSSSTPQL